MTSQRMAVGDWRAMIDETEAKSDAELCDDEGCPHYGTPHVCINRTQSDAEPVRAFAKAVLHGDDEHRAWLIEAAEAFIANKPLPVPRGKGAAPPRPDASAGLIEAAEKELNDIRDTMLNDRSYYDGLIDFAGDIERVAAMLRSRAANRSGK